MSDQVIWGIHMGREHGLAPVKDGYVAIGWAHVGDLSAIPAKREAFKASISQHYPDFKSGAVPVAAGVIYRFAREMKVGDVVVFPSKPDRMVNIGRIEGDYTNVRFASGQVLPREIERLSARLTNNRMNGEVTLYIQLLDFGILMQDQGVLNQGPRNRAADAATF